MRRIGLIVAFSVLAPVVHYWRWQALAAAVLLLAAAICLPAWFSPDRRHRKAAAVQDRLAAEAHVEDDDPSTRMPPEYEAAFAEQLRARGVRDTDPRSLRVASMAARAAIADLHAAQAGGAS